MHRTNFTERRIRRASLTYLGKGKYGVVYLTPDNKALKVFELSSRNSRKAAELRKFYQKEVDAIPNFDSEYVIKFGECYEALLEGDNGRSTLVGVIEMEAVTGGEMFDYIVKHRFSEPVARHFFN